jgi:hypothetical protein
VAAALRESRLERAIGVIYLPKTERLSHYFKARLPEQFDAVIHFDETRAVEPLDLTPGWVTGEPPETYPFGQRDEDIMSDRGKLIGGLLVGAAVMYLLDPERGGRRRALVRDQAARARHKLGDGLDATARDLGSRAKGTLAELRSRFRRDAVDDTIPDERSQGTTS